MFSQRSYEDASDQENALPGWQQQYLQLSQGSYAGEVALLELNGVTIIRERVNVALEQFYSAPDDSLIFYGHAPASGGFYVNGNLHGGSTLGFGCRWSERLAVSQCMSDMVMVVLDLASLGIRQQPPVGVFSGRSANQAQGLYDWLETLLDLHARDHGAVAGQTEDLLADMIKDRMTLLLEHGDLAQPEIRHPSDLKDYRLLVDWLESHPQEPVTVTELSAALKLPAARLRSACQTFTGYRLDDILLIRRLNHARRDLIAARDRPRKVSDVALDWGFFHWGRFAARYRQHFGETPSETVRNFGRQTLTFA
ncbi:AraC family ethanolamine operon transcriptional activator [Pararhizobium capsulatum DSM 1112]|uniref:AraC family ethanolamine operon transcriptional activator n=1 Tax=Pararhizobium capsulatum DSM 1112 TaxID=1121113 RepID=A0ABU0BWU4_9HYPH|nr:helix-turn-helix domain-containing protein [Pararhizobium capsulatum]MDQ0322735.1 AraC family ethanolamine operon transcriptional activator [Pararhizobium capsulatum DSM 1112]